MRTPGVPPGAPEGANYSVNKPPGVTKGVLAGLGVSRGVKGTHMIDLGGWSGSVVGGKTNAYSWGASWCLLAPPRELIIA